MFNTSDELFDALKHVTIGGNVCVYTKERCEEMLPLIQDIHRLKEEKNAVILAHSYVNPELLVAVADYKGDSYELSKRAQETDAQTIVFSAVKFMAETAKIVNPNKQVLIPSKVNGCSLADSITGQDVRNLKAAHPDFTFICYINTTADVKAECDICVTSSNVYDIVENCPNDKIYFLPDQLMGKNIVNEMAARGVKKTILYTDGRCYVHEEYNPEMIDFVRLKHPDAKIVCHPECDEVILERSDYVGSTSQMVSYVANSDANSFFLLTECGLSSRLQMEHPDKTFLGTCTMCRYMKSNTLEQIKRVLESPEAEDEVQLNDEVRVRAQRCIDAMFAYTK